MARNGFNVWILLFTIRGVLEYGGLLAFGFIVETLRALVQRAVAASSGGMARRAGIKRGFHSVFTRWVYGTRIDLWNRTLDGAPGTSVVVAPRHDTRNHGLVTHGGGEQARRCLNFGSYNYLGTGSESRECTDAVAEYLASPGARVATSSYYADSKSAVVQRLETRLVSFFGRHPERDDCVVFSIGWGGNVATISALTACDDVVISDSMNHNSIAMGCKLSKATKRVFAHNDMASLEAQLRWGERHIRDGGGAGRMFVIVEGVYSMEGDYTRLSDIVAFKTKYRFLVYMDEAHSSGCMGDSGRGMCEYLGVDPAAVDILMGTFSKSYGAMGAYVIASRELIRVVRARSCLSYASASMNDLLATQILAALDVIERDGSGQGEGRLSALRKNSVHFREQLKEAGFEVVGCDDSPVVPLILYSPVVMADFSRECLRRGLAVVIVGFPATPVFGTRVRFCLSARHTDADIQRALEVVCDIGRRHGIDVWSDRGWNTGAVVKVGERVVSWLYREFL